MSTASQPKNLQKMITRSAILLLVIALMVYGYTWYRRISQDIDLPASFDSAGYLSAVRLMDEGSQVVVFKPDGTMLESPGYVAGKYDKDAVWRPDGNRLLFISDREDNAQNVFRWNFGANRVARRTYNSRSKGLPTFAPGVNEGPAQPSLITSGGMVLQLDPVNGSTRQLVPPVEKERAATSEDSGAAGQFDFLYGKLGSSFKEAKWTPDRRFVVAVMRRDDGEALVVQDMSEDKPPMPLAIGDRVEFDIDPKSGRIAYLVLRYRLLNPEQAPKEFIKNGVVKLPFLHVLAIADPVAMLTDPSAGIQIMAQSNSADAFQRVSISPDGSMVLVVDGAYDAGKNEFQPRSMIVMPFQPGASQSATVVLREPIYEPSWHPNSNTIAFVKYNNDKERAIYTINRDGSAMTELSKGKGDFAWPKFSPQSK